MGLLNWLGLSSNTDVIKEFISRNAIIIDVRTQEEFRDGHLENSLNIVLDTLEENIEKIKKMNVPVIACCRSGARSGIATGILQKNGIECVNGGSWQSLKNEI
jgi:phage shock protein E